MWEESRRKRLKESEDKRHSWAGHEDMGGVSGLRSNSEADVAAAFKRELLKMSRHSPCRSPQHRSVTFDPCGSDTLVLPPIHSLSITNTTEEPEIQKKTLCIQESQNNDLQTQSQETSGNTEVTPCMTSDTSQISLVEVINDDSERKTIDKVQPTKEPIKNSAGAKQTISKRTFSSKNRASLSAKLPSSSSKTSSSSSSSSPKCVSGSETASLRKLVPLRSSAQIQERPGGSVAKKTQAFRPEEKMCRVTLLTLDRPSPQTSACNSTVKSPSFARNTVASTTRHATAPGNQAKVPALTRTASLRLSQVLKPTQTPAETVRPSLPAGRLRKSSAASEISAETVRPSPPAGRLRKSSAASEISAETVRPSLPAGRLRKSSAASESSAETVRPPPPAGRLRKSSATSESAGETVRPSLPAGRLRKSSAASEISAETVRPSPPAGRLRKSSATSESAGETVRPSPPAGRLRKSSAASEISTETVRPSPPAGRLRKSSTTSESAGETVRPSPPAGRLRKSSAASEISTETVRPSPPAGRLRKSSATSESAGETVRPSPPAGRLRKSSAASEISTENCSPVAPCWTPEEEQCRL